jgi:hypothetical protein
MPELGPAAVILLSFIAAISAVLGVYGATGFAVQGMGAARRDPRLG